jgi:thiol:disulfide interchange protein
MAACRCFAVAAFTLALTAGAASAQTEVDWRAGHDAALGEARRNGRPALVYFRADWAGACVELERSTFADSRALEAMRRFIAVRLDMTSGDGARRGRELLTRYGERSLPLIIMFDTHGRLVMRLTSFVEAATLLEKLAEVH